MLSFISSISKGSPVRVLQLISSKNCFHNGGSALLLSPAYLIHICSLNLGMVDGAEDVNTDSSVVHNRVANAQNLVRIVLSSFCNVVNSPAAKDFTQRALGESINSSFLVGSPASASRKILSGVEEVAIRI